MSLTLAYFFIVIGLLLLAGELFFPTGGILFLSAMIAIGIGVVMTFIYGDRSTGILTLTGVFVAVPFVSYAGAVLWPRTPWGKLFVQPGTSGDATLAELPVNKEAEMLRGRHGKAISDLRPSGTAEFDGKRVDVLSEGPMIADGTWVRCIDVKPGRVIVRAIDAPNLDKIDFDRLDT